MSDGAFVDIPHRLVIFEGRTGGKLQIGRTRSNHVILVRNCQDCEILFVSNQRLRDVIFFQCRNVTITFLDSLVVVNRTCRLLDCSACHIIVEDVDIRRIECHDVTETTVTQIISEPVTENAQIYWFGRCLANHVHLSELQHVEKSMSISFTPIDESEVPENTENFQFFTYFDSALNHHHAPFTTNGDLTSKGKTYFNKLENFVPEKDRVLWSKVQILEKLKKLENQEFTLTNDELECAYDDERKEYYDSEDILKEKVRELANELRKARHAVFYTGAGISTSANIPDFRGPNGVWTMRDKGQSVFRSSTKAQPTLSHYAITELARAGFLKFVVSTNMDALHLRSGLPVHMISEQHGNKHKERCEQCGSEYYRQFDTLASVTSTRGHRTGRNCTFCNGGLKDTIIHFSETLRQEDMHSALYHARLSDLAVVMGTSMNVQPAASFPDKCFKNNGKIIIVNLQKTPYDALASIRIFAKTDDVMRILMEELSVTSDFSEDKISTWDAMPEESPEMENDEDYCDGDDPVRFAYDTAIFVCVAMSLFHFMFKAIR